MLKRSVVREYVLFHDSPKRDLLFFDVKRQEMSPRPYWMVD